MITITTTIQREWLREIVAGRKRVEYREIKPYWDRRLVDVPRPFLLRLINGMTANAPEVTVRIDRVVRRESVGEYRLYIGAVVRYRNWDKRLEQPALPKRSR